MVAVRAAVAAGLLLVAGGIVAALAQPATDFISESSRQVDLVHGVIVRPRQTACQPRQDVPAGAAEVRLIVSTNRRSGPPLAFTATAAGGEVVARGTSPSGYRDRPVDVPLSKRPARASAAIVCVRNPGPVRVAILGPDSPRRVAARVTPKRRPQAAAMRLEWHRAPVGSRFERLGEIAGRAGLAKASFVGSWALWAVFGLLLAGGALGVVAMLRGTRR